MLQTPIQWVQLKNTFSLFYPKSNIDPEKLGISPHDLLFTFLTVKCNEIQRI